MSASSGAPIPLEGWQGSTGISGSFQSESVATFAWNRWQVSTGISGNFRAEYAAKPIQLLYYPPYHSKYNPIARCWGMLELHWNGTKLVDVETMLEWAKSMTWKGIQPVVALSHKGDQKGIAIVKKAMQEVERRLERHPALPKWNILIRPASALS